MLMPATTTKKDREEMKSDVCDFRKISNTGNMILIRRAITELAVSVVTFERRRLSDHVCGLQTQA